MNRRNFLLTGLATSAVLANNMQDKRAPLGIAWTSFLAARRVNDALALARIAVDYGASGVQGPFANPTADAARELRTYLDAHGLYFEGAAPFPDKDAVAFEAQLVASKAAGARCVRFACLSGRRYETFSTMDEWQAFVARSRDGLKRAVAIAERVKMPLALENHKDWTAVEMAALMREYSSEYLGVCLDFGNNISLIDDPYDVVERLAPYTISTHFKDATFAINADALLLGDVTPGAGALDLARMLNTLKSGGRKPKLSLEMITRAPLRVPVFTAKYWRTFPAREGSRLAQLAELAAHTPAVATWSAPTSAEHLTMEEANIRRSLAWSAAHVDWSV